MKPLLFLALTVALSAHAGEVKLEWDANTDTIDGYVVHWKDEGPERTQPSKGTTATLSGLVHGRRYEVWVTAVMAGVESLPSNRISGIFIAASLEQSDDLGKWQTVFTRGDLVEVPRCFYRVRMGD